MEGFRLDVCLWISYRVQLLTEHSYNRYLAVAARVVRRSLKEGERLKAERRGEMELRFAKWEVGPAYALGTKKPQMELIGA